jgi:glycosyltransferase involved in cell wall biosynthesis
MFDRNPLVSIVIPVYNGANYLHEAIASALAQTYPDIEVIVVNDGSNDSGETERIARSYGESIRYFSQENGGVARALNLGIREMKGEYFAWLSHDDVFLPEKIARQTGFLKQNPGFAACYTDYLQIDAKGNKSREIETPWLPKKKALKALFGRQYINGSTMVVRRDCFEQVGMFAEHLRYTQDMEMWLRLLQRFEIGRVPHALAKQRVHAEQGSRETQPQQKEAQQVLDRSFADLGAKGLLAVASAPAGSAEERARRHTWYGLTLSRCRGWYAKGTEELEKARACWPSWRNPARLYLLFKGLWPAFHAWQRFRVRIIRSLMERIRSLAKKA